jgi:hypothetical protein
MKLFEILNELWSGKVDTKVTPPEGLFASGTAAKIAEWSIQSHHDLKSAMASLNFYVNRAGKNLTHDRRSTIDTAKNLVRRHFEKS